METERRGSAKPWWIAGTGVVAAQIAAVAILLGIVAVSVGFDDFPGGNDNEGTVSVGTNAADAGAGVDELGNLGASGVAGAGASVSAGPVFVTAAAASTPGGLGAGTAGVFGVGPGIGGEPGGAPFIPGEGQPIPPGVVPPGGGTPGTPGGPNGPGAPMPPGPGSPTPTSGTGNPLNNILWGVDSTVDGLAGLNTGLAPTTDPVTVAVDEVLLGATGNDLEGHLHAVTDPLRDPPILGSRGEGVLGTGLFP